MKSTTLIMIGIVGCLVGMGAGCTAPDVARKALTGAGYTEIQTTGYCWFCCGKDDTFHTGFTAKGPTGQPVVGAVCSGWFKGATIRTF